MRVIQHYLKARGNDDVFRVTIVTFPWKEIIPEPTVDSGSILGNHMGTGSRALAWSVGKQTADKQ